MRRCYLYKEIAELIDNNDKTIYRWKKEGRPIVFFFEKYFTKEDIEEFLKSGKIEKLDSLAKLDSFFNSFSLEIEKKITEKLKITGDNYSFYDFDAYVSLFFLKKEYRDLDDIQLKILKYISDDNKLSQNQKISYMAAISVLNKIEFYIISKELFLKDDK